MKEGCPNKDTLFIYFPRLEAEAKRHNSDMTVGICGK